MDAIPPGAEAIIPGSDKVYGARPLARFIQEHIKKPLAEELLFGKLTKGGTVRVTLKDDKLGFEFEAPKRPPPKGGPSGRGGGRDDHDRPGSPSNGSGSKIPELVH